MKTEKAEKVESRRLEAEKVQTEEMQVKGIQEEGVQVKGMKIEEAELEKMVQHQMRIIRQGAEALIGEEELEGKIRRSIFTGKPLNIKFGMDPSAPDLHLGHAVALRKLRQMQKLGHHIIIVIGDFTAKIGDPTGKSKGRKALSDREVLENAGTYQEQVFRILDREKTEVRYNGEWLELLALGEVLKMASTITVARMLVRDDFEKRFQAGTPIGLHEFFYPLMQAYDSVELEADLELGGTDQTFNILLGRALQKEYGQESQAALFMPILEGIDGVEKMSKSLGNYIGIEEDAREMFAKTMRVPDGLILKYFELATDILPEELDSIREELADGCNPRDVKLKLAREITELYWGKEEAEKGEEFFRTAFMNRENPEDVQKISVVWESGTLFDCVKPLVSAGCVESGGELRRLIAQGGVKKDGVTVKTLEEAIQNGTVLRIGKRRFVRIETC